jgi:hypothetical protein
VFEHYFLELRSFICTRYITWKGIQNVKHPKIKDWDITTASGNFLTYYLAKIHLASQ